MQRINRANVERWTQERIESLSTPEIRQLQANALRLNETEIAALCEVVLGARPRGRGAPRRS